MTKAFILAGTNLEDREANLEFARRALAKGGIITTISSCFETEPVGFLDQPWFLNQAIELETRLEPRELLFFCHTPVCMNAGLHWSRWHRLRRRRCTRC